MKQRSGEGRQRGKDRRYHDATRRAPDIQTYNLTFRRYKKGNL